MKTHKFLDSLFYRFLSLFILFVLVITVQAQTEFDDEIKFSADFRLRYENTSNAEPDATFLEGRNREVVRFRAGITKQINKLIKFGARIATGSSNDPNTTDVTLGNFVNDLEISLDQLFIELQGKGFSLNAGKFANPFLRTDLVWDGDVCPQGLAGSYSFSGSTTLMPKITGIYYMIDEHPGKDIKDSEMFGGQLQLVSKPSDDFNITLAGGYFNYNINLNATNADAGDTRSNSLVFDTTGTPVSYVSDFRLLDVIAVVEYKGFGEKFPLKFVGDYVKNLGVVGDQDQGFMLDLFLGRASKQNDVRFRYGYSQTETDAVLAAFSNDNTTIATNYKQHTFTIDYVPFDNVVLNATWYVYKYNQVADGVENEFISRLRLNAVVKI